MIRRTGFASAFGETAVDVLSNECVFLLEPVVNGRQSKNIPEPAIVRVVQLALSGLSSSTDGNTLPYAQF